MVCKYTRKSTDSKTPEGRWELTEDCSEEDTFMVHNYCHERTKCTNKTARVCYPGCAGQTIGTPLVISLIALIVLLCLCFCCRFRKKKTRADRFG